MPYPVFYLFATFGFFFLEPAENRSLHHKSPKNHHGKELKL